MVTTSQLTMTARKDAQRGKPAAARPGNGPGSRLPLLGCLLWILVCATSCRGGPSASPAAKSLTLTNGLRVVSVCFPGSTNAAIFTYLPMGLAGDGPNQAQWAHLVEHLVIRSTQPGDLSQANAETLPNHMRLDFYGNLGNWKEGLSQQRRWLQGVPFTQASLEAEKPKVAAECDFTARNFATHKFALAAWAQGYRHDQKRAALKQDVARASLADIQAYRDSRLALLSNVVVCIAGGLDSAQTLPVAAAALGTIGSRATPAPPVQLHPGRHEMTWDLPARHLVLTWPISAAPADDFPALLAAAQWLNMQLFSDPELKKMAGLALAGADLRTPEGNFFFISACLRPGATFQGLEQRLERPLQRLTSPDQDLSVLPLLSRQLAEGLTQVPNPSLLRRQPLPPGVTPAMVELNLGLQWGMNEFLYGPHKEALARQLSRLTPEQVRQAARKFLAPAHASVVILEP
jgi:predicted Zn-dependent peptidase